MWARAQLWGWGGLRLNEYGVCIEMEKVKINVSELYAHQGQAKLSSLYEYEESCLKQAGLGTDVILTGNGPIWMYLRLAHALHGKVRSLYYESPVTGLVEIFNHNPY